MRTGSWALGPALFSLHGGRALLERICGHLDVPVAQLEERDFEDGEHKVRPLESVRGRDVYVVESLHGDASRSVDDKLVRVLFALAALRDAGAQRLTVLAPYLCYARKDMRTKPRDPVTTRHVAQLFEASGAQRIVTLDVHNRAAYENAFRIPAEHLTAAPLLVAALVPLVGASEVVVVSPDAGGVKRAERFRQVFERQLGRAVSFAFVEKFRSEGVLRGSKVAGDVQGRCAVIVDDLISSGRTLARGAAVCRELGASRVFAAVTHGVFSAESGTVLSGSALERILLLDTIARPLPPGLSSELLLVLDAAPLLAEAIRRLHDDAPLSGLGDACA
jgi:ribose-phosphate pyrophosphokinase